MLHTSTPFLITFVVTIEFFSAHYALLVPITVMAA